MSYQATHRWKAEVTSNSMYTFFFIMEYEAAEIIEITHTYCLSNLGMPMSKLQYTDPGQCNVEALLSHLSFDYFPYF